MCAALSDPTTWDSFGSNTSNFIGMEQSSRADAGRVDLASQNEPVKAGQRYSKAMRRGETRDEQWFIKCGVWHLLSFLSAGERSRLAAVGGCGFLDQLAGDLEVVFDCLWHCVNPFCLLFVN